MRWLWVVVLAVGCGDDSTASDGGLDGGESDAGVDASADSSADVGGDDAGTDAPALDAALDAEVPSHVFFHSDWSTAMGTDDEAVLDGDTWDFYKGSNPRGATEVVATSSLGFEAPAGMDNCLMIRSTQNTQEGVRMATLPIPAAGETQWRRYYVAVVLPDDATFDDQSFHPLDFRDTMSGTWTLAPHFDLGDDDSKPGVWWHDIAAVNDASLEFGEEKYVLGTSVGAAEHPFGGRRGMTELDKRTWYGIEYQVFRVSDTHVRARAAWVYDVDGNVIYDADDFFLNDETDTPMADEAVDWAIDDEQDFAHFQLGVNGFPPGYPVADVFCWGAVAMSNQEQLGPYNGVY